MDQYRWVNIDKPAPVNAIIDTVRRKPLEAMVENGKEFDRVHTYIVYTSIKSLYRMNTKDNLNFYAGNEVDRTMWMTAGDAAVAIAIGYKGETPALAVKLFETGTDTKLSLTLAPSTLDEVKNAIKPYEEKYRRENSMTRDLDFMEKLYKEKLRQKELQKENEFMWKLWYKAFPCAGVGEMAGP